MMLSPLIGRILLAADYQVHCGPGGTYTYHTVHYGKIQKYNLIRLQYQ